ncbi:metalloregulator ArsR/SmtB family transcription factor [Idiomarina sp. HP20-50]|uniref:metalloregulator ArsR/SmtB family transcription factor n=1 Tax=Idiomarina sp. HP20-50 TaxID=3070813 RepID=UPI00294AD4F8|nr:metalloregulator ArsR/SmtB family transcription factor [Idiomarina sp. HP20-50]MDV6315683.1 metalloregulator ArsR/SmtB family transcription factor [Idiomarina sp. HP20-50]
MSTKVLFLCTANSARSLMAEAILRQFGNDELDVYSAGTEPTEPKPEAIEALNTLGVSTDGLRSKAVSDLSISEFDYVISLCDRARSECQLQYKNNHFIAWDFPDPSGSNKPNALKKTAHELSERIKMFLLILRKNKDSQMPHLFNAPEGFFKIMADPLRLTMISLLAKHKELCVCEFVDATGMSQPKVSRHLAQLREYGLLTDRKDQRWVYYQLNSALPDWMRKVIITTAEYNPQLIKDIENGCV